MNQTCRMKAIRIISIMLLLLMPATFVMSCRTSNTGNKERQIQREKRKRSKNDTVLYQKALKRHMKSQTKDTRSSMRRALAIAKRNRDHKREFFLRRWFKDWFTPNPQDKPNKG